MLGLRVAYILVALPLESEVVLPRIRILAILHLMGVLGEEENKEASEDQIWPL